MRKKIWRRRVNKIIEFPIARILHCNRITSLTIFLLFTQISLASSPERLFLSDPNLRLQRVRQLSDFYRARKEYATQYALSHNWRIKDSSPERSWELMYFDENNMPIYYQTQNVNAAISIAVDQVRQTAPYYLDGTGVEIGIWDAGHIRYTHQEFAGSRVQQMSAQEGVTYSSHYHSTHIGGTVGAAGIVASSKGMAPNINIDSYEWNNDIPEMTSRAMSHPSQSGKIQLSNHSYGPVTGWEDGTFYEITGRHWFGTWGQRESEYFGRYDSETRELDQLCYDAPYYLPFKSAGNERSGARNTAPAAGTLFWYLDKFNRLKSKTYNSATDPYSDFWDNGGFDNIVEVATAKNCLTVGGVNDAVTGSQRDLAKATMTSFSSWGPTDDGRIKPDVVTNASSLYSTDSDTDTDYRTMSGTSVASPAALGAAALLIQYYDDLFPSQKMRASTIKGLIIHTADDLPAASPDGPDYKFGWGLVNAKAAADQIADLNDFPAKHKITESLLSTANPSDSYTFWAAKDTPLKATICWTDPPATALSTLDNPSPRLVNDLDIRISDPNGNVFFPFILDRLNPATPATNGDNTIDNVEQIFISALQLTGTYTVQVTHKSSLSSGQQYYSLIVSGQSHADLNSDTTLNIADLNLLTNYWLSSEASVDIAPPGGDGIINLLDLEILLTHWQ
jgi:hypothetical protein